MSGTTRRRFNGAASGDDDDDEGYSTTGSGSGDEGGRRASYDDEVDDDDSTVYDGGGTSLVTLRQREEDLVQSALRRIARAQAKGKADVKLSKDELAALERRRQRMQEEEERERQKKRDRRQRGSGSGSERKKSKEQRLAVPLTQLQPMSRKKQTSRHPPRKDSMPRHVSASNVPDSRDRQVYPPMGYFPPPSASRARARSSAGPALEDNVPYEYLPPPPPLPAGAGRSRSSRGSPRDDATMLSTSRSNIDPFQFQTASPTRQSKRHVSGPAEFLYGQTSRRGAATAPSTRSRHPPRRTSYNGELSTDSQTSEESISDERGNGAQIREPTASVAPTSGYASGRGNGIVVEVSPERKKKKSSSSPVKRKSSKKKKK